MTMIAFWLRPVDTLFFRDGRAFDAASRPSSRLPLPHTLVGALRSWILRRHLGDLDAIRAAREAGSDVTSSLRAAGGAGVVAAELTLRGPWLAQRDGRSVRPYLPAPADVSASKSDGRSVRLRPLERMLPGWHGPAPDMRPLWHAGIEVLQRVSGFLDADGLAEWAEGRAPRRLVERSRLLLDDPRTGIAVDHERRTAGEGLIYGVSHLAMAEGVGFYAEVVLPDDVDDLLPPDGDVLSWGGEGRRVVAERCEPFAWPPEPPAKEPSVYLLTTPLPGVDGWCPNGLRPVAAGVPAADLFSGWDLALRAPRRTRSAAPAGSVYFVEQAGDTVIPVPGSLCSDEDDARSGFGTFIRGVWPK